MRSLHDSVLRITNRTEWRLAATVTVQGDVGHPQGITRWGEHWLVSTVFPDQARGALLLVDADGSVLESLDVTDAERFHPGGMSNEPGGCWVPVAEYRPRSTTRVMRVEPAAEPTVESTAVPGGSGLVTTKSFVFDDHLGAVCPLADGTLFAVSWGSRRWYRLDTNGQVLARRRNPSYMIDLQDMQALDDGRVLATGIAPMSTPLGTVQLGGMVVIEVDTLSLVHETPVAAWMPSGRVATFNATHLEVDGDRLLLHCLVDDTTAEIATWVADLPAPA